MLKNFLITEFEKRKLKKQKYSIRKFAQDLKIESSTLSKILSGTRPIKPTTAVKILEQLQIDWAMKNTLLLSIFNPRSILPTDTDFDVLEDSAGSSSSYWEFYTVLSLAEFKTFEDDPIWIAKKIGTSVENATYILGVLKKLNLITLKNNRYTATGVQITTSPGKFVEIVREAHKQTLSKSIEVLLTQEDHDISDFTGVTIATSKEKITEAIRRIKEFRRSLASFLHEPENPDAVYRLGIQLFPFTNKE
ncbi:MAG: hypothetical protein A2622_10800 [Bdellovibrionales bacterium RIFCSPHIGHO2_01_FULL_40_29]|nr:MAG: hypothetical protein A2622_10800 [Bdellovibrionales bacterium RIFCSPHIGHO2_01_FULL_40_29]OFZ34444.1 MAG: hypothetical protein A3D17_01065 [Bdellovibrionales bacterium RIFCSPHIGHO2_02_FULL_40_15]